MYVCEGLKLNKFRDVAIPANHEYFARYGYTNTPAVLHTGDELAPHAKTKIDTFADMEQYDLMKQNEENDLPKD